MQTSMSQAPTDLYYFTAGPMSWVVLPAVADIFDSGPPIRDMGSTVGWGTFVVEHLIYGTVLGVVVALAVRPRRRALRQPEHVRERVSF